MKGFRVHLSGVYIKQLPSFVIGACFDALRIVQGLQDSIALILGVLARVVLILHGQIRDSFHDFGRLDFELPRLPKLVELAEGCTILLLEGQEIHLCYVWGWRRHLEQVRDVIPLEESSLPGILQDFLCQKMLVDLAMVDLLLYRASEYQSVHGNLRRKHL